jgi:hypothetical protein
VRDGWSPRIIDLRKAERFAMVGCNRYWYTSGPVGGRITNAPRGLLYFPGFNNFEVNATACRPPPDGGGGGGRRRSWWQAVTGPSPTPATVPDTEYLAGGELVGPEGVSQVMAVTIGGEAYVRADQSLNWAALSVSGGVLWVGNKGFIAVDARGRDLRTVRILYKGQEVPAASWPGSVQPWRGVAEGSRVTSMVSKGQRHHSGGHVAPYDACAPVYVHALLSRPRILVSEVQ